MITLDSLRLNNVSFIKADLQGAETLFLWGARETIKRCKPALRFEETLVLKKGVMSAENAEELQVRACITVPATWPLWQAWCRE